MSFLFLLVGSLWKIELDAPALIKDDRTFVPLRAIAEAFGERVDWDNDKRVVVIGEGYDASKIKEEKKEVKEEKKGFFAWLKSLIFGED